MNDDETLKRLAARAGVENVYWDISGQRQETSPEIARAILAAQGLPVRTSSDIAMSLTALEEAPWREVLPPVIVGREGQATTFALHLPAAFFDKPAIWSVHLEDGSLRVCGLDIEAAARSGAREIDGRAIERRILHLPPLPCGYHRLEFSGAVGTVFTPVIVAPPSCYLPPALADGRRWGIAAQLYAMHTARNLGIGDFSDLAALLDWARDNGADAVGVNPLHALFSSAPAHASPYSPNSRYLLNPLYLDVTATPDFAESEAARAILNGEAAAAGTAMARAATLVDYAAVDAIKRPVFDALYENFRARHLGVAGDARSEAFLDFQARGGRLLERFALHAALCEAFGTQDWNAWATGYRNPASDECLRFAREHADRVAFHQYLQWQCDLQLSAAAARAGRRGMGVGLYGDLAVSASPDGADVWGAQDLFAAAARIGAPPDPFNDAGQEWGVVPMNPLRMRKTGYADFIALLRANMRHFGALRIDHAMGLQRLFWIPRGAPTASGAYVNYPLDDLLAILALESRRNECLIIGEDLGTVPEGFRERMAEANVLSYRVLYFESRDGRFKPPESYPPLSAACVSTHDLPTLKGFWEETDLDDRIRAGVLQPADEPGARATRRSDKQAVLAALADAGLLSPGVDPGSPEAARLTPELAAAIHRFLARSAARLCMVQIDDMAGEAAQANLPGTTDSYPNWRRRLNVSLERIGLGEVARRIIAAMAEERPPAASKAQTSPGGPTG
jgi:4-alpha-glucanotransferase